MNRRAGTVLAIVVALLVLLAVVAGVVSATRSDPVLPEGSPEAAVQDYVSAVYEEDAEAAAEWLDPDGRCTVEDLEDARTDAGPRIVLREVDVDGDEATVDVDRVRGENGPFGGGEWTEDLTFELERRGDRWVIVGEPWPMYGCLGDQRIEP